jgi:dihydrodiol dehydrogenase / D-xylose 1-dehydrogenase (NADP)
MPNPKTYNWGFVAAGAMARNQARDLAESPRAKIYGVFSRTQQSADAFSNEFGSRTFSTLEEMLADLTIDIVYISSPNQLHYPQAKQALEAGKAVLCEKPFTLNGRQLADLIEIARRRKVFLMEAMWIRYLPVIVKLRQILDQGAFGEIKLARAAFHLDLPVNPTGRIYNPDLGGGSLLDLGIYPISFVSMLLGAAPDQIVSHAQMTATGVDAHFGAVFHYVNGSMASVSAGIDGQYVEDIVIQGTRGKIVILGHRWWKLSTLSLQLPDRDPETIELPHIGSGYLYQAEEVMRCLDNGEFESPVMPLAESLAIMQTMDRLRLQWKFAFPAERLCRFVR